MPRALKVFRTAIGFHDAYVAAPSRAAALRAWGASRDLFARGVAEEVTDAGLMEAPLAHPGEVIRRSRGTAEEQIAALPATPEAVRRAEPEEEAPVRRRAAAKRTAAPGRTRGRGEEAPPPSPPPPPPKPEPKPKPSRETLDAAEEAVAAAEARFAGARRAIEARQAALDRERRQLAAEQEREAARLEAARAAAERDFAAAMRAWRAE